jgi:UDP-N-acetylmuramate--alanine ligase
MAAAAADLYRGCAGFCIYPGGVYLMKHIHLIGIGGTGLSAIAQVLLERGFTVSGSDRESSPAFQSVSEAGAQTFLGHAPENITDADLVIRSSAITDENPEVISALSQGIPVLKRRDFLEELTAGSKTIAVAGSHGKTTTTAMLIWILHQLGTDPSYISGGMITQLGSNAHAGSGPYFVIEADEYDYMFLGLKPRIAIITNIEHDHPDCFPTPDAYQAAFKAFLEQVQPDGKALLCLDDPGAQSLKEVTTLPQHQCIGYGSKLDADYRAENIIINAGYPQFELTHQQENGAVEPLGTVRLSIPGLHNVLNATAALGAIHLLGLPIRQAIQAVGGFTGAGRRFEVLGQVDGITVVDDYGHHPSEIAATLAAAKTRYPGQRLWAVWQPHTYTRTQNLQKEFAQALSLADKALVLQIYAAREPDPGYSAEQIVHALPGNTAFYAADFLTASEILLKNLVEGDVVFVFSAGDATQLSQLVLHRLHQRDEELNK